MDTRQVIWSVMVKDSPHRHLCDIINLIYKIIKVTKPMCFTKETLSSRNYYKAIIAIGSVNGGGLLQTIVDHRSSPLWGVAHIPLNAGGFNISFEYDTAAMCQLYLLLPGDISQNVYTIDYIHIMNKISINSDVKIHLSNICLSNNRTTKFHTEFMKNALKYDSFRNDFGKSTSTSTSTSTSVVTEAIFELKADDDVIETICWAPTWLEQFYIGVQISEIAPLINYLHPKMQGYRLKPLKFNGITCCAFSLSLQTQMYIIKNIGGFFNGIESHIGYFIDIQTPLKLFGRNNNYIGIGVQDRFGLKSKCEQILGTIIPHVVKTFSPRNESYLQLWKVRRQTHISHKILFTQDIHLTPQTLGIYFKNTHSALWEIKIPKCLYLFYYNPSTNSSNRRERHEGNLHLRDLH